MKACWTSCQQYNLRIIITAGYIIDPGFGIIDIPPVAEGVEFAQRAGHGAGGGQRIAPRVIGISNHLRAATVDQPGHVALRVLQVEVLRTIVGDGHGADLIVGEVQGRAAVRLNNSDLRQRVTEVGVACPRSLARVDDLIAGIADVVEARLGAGADTLHQPAFKSHTEYFDSRKRCRHSPHFLAAFLPSK